MVVSTIDTGMIRHCVIAGLCASVLYFGVSAARSNWGQNRPEISPDEVETVSRLSLDVSVNAPGVIESSSNTRVECGIERLELRVQGRTLASNGSTRILTLVPDGSMVKQGDVICTLESSQFDEMLRTQQINVERAKSEELQAEMELEVAKISLEEYRNGSLKQQVQTLKGQIALAQTDSARLTSRIAWARKMFQKGYLSQSAMRSEELQMQRSDIQFSNSQIALKTLEKYTLPKLEHQFRTRIISLERVLVSEQERTKRMIDRLHKYEEMIEKCTIRAPHDGMLVYANDTDRNFRVEEGTDVRQGQTLFYLPDLTRMQVMARLSESVVKQVSPGMRVRIDVESVLGRTYNGTVERIAQFPIPPSSWRSSNDIKNYYCVVRVDDVDSAVRPGLNAEIDILTDMVEDTIVLSPEAVEVEGNREFCYVRLADGTFEKRQIRTRTGDPSSLAILEGLEEGDVVLRNLTKVDKNPEYVTRVAMLNQESTEGSDVLVVETEDRSSSLVAAPPLPKDGELNTALPAGTTGY
jgi:HlyD family secretion protein